jgi:peptidylprolyl isomerase
MNNNSTSSSKRQARAQRQSARARRNAMLRNIAIGVVALAAIVIVIILVSSHKPASTNQPSAGGATPALVGTKTYASAPPMLIDKTKQYFATVKMATGGEFVIQLFPDKAPIAVNSFVFLANQGFFNGLTFHRVLSGFMAQGGDPTGTGGGGPGYNFDNEPNDLTFDKAGVVAMANTGAPNSNGSQFFITFAPQAYLNGGYTIFGQVTSGMDVVMAIKLRDPEKSPNYLGDAMQSVTITEK